MRPNDQPPPPPQHPVNGSGGGLRYDSGKNRLDLLPAEWIWGLGRVTTAGALKYADRNWEKGMPWSKVWGPMLRHAFKFLAGERYDEETGCHHLLMVAWNALALFTYDLKKMGENDVWGVPQPWNFDFMDRFCQQPPSLEGSPTEPSLFHGIRPEQREGVE